ncbi:dihydroxyacetone kinase subunit DhaK [Lacticaseibacillus thailandensis]|uniref:dihydroxyacetone kinase subunit DhaK n=1 Tax=Lacticaseibacillus thailandensis TaxID=381741 RepID=UPI000ABD73FF|nr:dihydroxyacetone kinase subunit DhaK [Lacticaseibacillus thailandensis]
MQDVTQFTAARDELRQAGWHVGMAIVRDDVSVAGTDFQQRRRGVAGTVLVHKIIGAAAAQGMSVDKLQRLADQLLPEIKTIGFSSSGAVIPGHSNPSFKLPENTISYGVGIHGEPGYHEEPFQSSEMLAHELVNKLQINFHWRADDHFAVLVDSLGGTTAMETLVFANDVRQLLSLAGVHVDFAKVGTFLSSNGMHGLSLSLLHLVDPSWLQLLQAPVQTPSWPQA